jgi:hypothetical protein
MCMGSDSSVDATIITTNLNCDDWYTFLGKREMVGALLDRLRHCCA